MLRQWRWVDRAAWASREGLKVAAKVPLEVDRAANLGIIACAMRGGAEAARWAHNPKVEGSNPSPATRGPVADGAVRAVCHCLSAR